MIITNTHPPLPKGWCDVCEKTRRFVVIQSAFRIYPTGFMCDYCSHMVQEYKYVSGYRKVNPKIKYFLFIFKYLNYEYEEEYSLLDIKTYMAFYTLLKSK